MTTAYISHPDCLRHEMGAWHPESPARLAAIERELCAAGSWQRLQHFTAPPATRAQLERVHDPRYLDALAAVAPQEGLIQLDPDTAMNPHTLAAALHAAGAAVLATDLLLEGAADNAFCAVRPPGHHAERGRAMGFCFFNNVAVGVAHALERHQLSRVAIVDFDVHHGNGTEDIFRDDERVLMVSTFQHPFYPGSGIEGRSGRMVNVPLRAGSGGAEFRAAIEEQWLPAFESFRPQMLFVSAGFDAHRDDDMAGLLLDDADYHWAACWIKAAAERLAQGRVVSLLEGGYQLPALARNAADHIAVLLGD
ncbi:MAG TPA: histone deacetylase family protein [Burkholderiales bacterium]|nr:histone deacetylase family protein [Burkholderiales bacterium]